MVIPDFFRNQDSQGAIGLVSPPATKVGAGSIAKGGMVVGVDQSMAGGWLIATAVVVVRLIAGRRFELNGFGGQNRLASSFPATSSGGNAQRAAICCYLREAA